MLDRSYISLYKKLVAKKLPFPRHPHHWKQRDMEALAKLIEERSGVKLSLSTLKRLWKPDFDQTPHPSTLDALVSVLDYHNWLEFKEKHQLQLNKPSVEKTPLSRKKLAWGISISLLIVVVGLLAITTTKNGGMLPVVHGPVTFQANKTVSEGVPNTVIFKYDVSQVEADSFYIQQSWNKIHREPINAEAKNYSSTYYTPGFHRAKLIAQDSIIRQSRVHITTDGWLALARYHRNDLVPVYLRNEAINTGGELRVSESLLQDHGVDVKRNFILSYHNTREFDGLHSDNFTLNTSLKVDSLGNYACPEALITIICEEHIFYVPITSKGCVGNLSVKFGEIVKDGKAADFSGLGTDIYQWQDLSIRVKDKHAQVFLNQQLTYEIDFKEDFGLIMGLRISFTGPGSVDDVSLQDASGKLVYQDSFL